MSEGGVAASGTHGADGGGQRAPGADLLDEFFRPGDGGVEQIALQHHPRAGRDRDDHRQVLRVLRAVDRHRVRVGQFVEFVEVAVNEFVFVGP